MTDPRTSSTESVAESDCWALLRTAEVGRLALAVCGRLEIFPVNFVVDHGSIVFRTGEGTKLAALQVDPQVVFEADGHDDGDDRVGGDAWSVVLRGPARELRRFDDLIEADDLPLHPVHGGPKNRFVRLVPDEITGRRFKRAPEQDWRSPLTGRTRAARE
jgi:hypothetical protein